MPFTSARRDTPVRHIGRQLVYPTIEARARTGSHCIAFLCDQGYIFPTLVCAKQARANAPEGTQIIIFIDAPSFDESVRARLESVSGVTLKLIPESVKELLEAKIPKGFFKTHVTRAAMFRLFVADLLEDSYDRILYMDGDIQVRRPMAPLFSIPLGKGEVGVVPDWVAICSADGMPHVEANRKYLDGLHFTPDQWSSYFNSGVMMASSDTWKEIGPVALEFLSQHPEACRLHDQSALNFACRGRTKRLSPRWNFLRQYLSLPAYREIDPAVVHFVGRWKPWDGVFAPWSRTEFQPYVDMARAIRGTGVVWKRKPLLERMAGKVKPLFIQDEFANAAYRKSINTALKGLASELE